MRWLYALLALATVFLTFIAISGLLQGPRLEWGLYAAIGLLGFGLTLRNAIRAWRGKTTDERLLFVWGFGSGAVRYLFEYSKKGDTQSLIIGVGALIASLGTLVAFIRHPAPPAPEPPKEDVILARSSPLRAMGKPSAARLGAVCCS